MAASDDDQWITFEDAVGLVRSHLGASIGRSQAVARTARSSGEVRTRKRSLTENEPVLLTNDDGLMRWNQRSPAPDLDPAGARLFNKADFLDWLNRQAPAPIAPAAAAPAETVTDKSARRGRPPAYDWSGAIQKFAEKLMDYHGEFSQDDPKWNAQARLEEAITNEFSPEKSAVRDWLKNSNFLINWRKAKAGK
jgi:hypothetical protein